MAGPAATVGSNHVCPMCSGVVPHVGGPITQGDPTVLIEGKPAATIGSMCVCVGPPDVIVTGVSNVIIGGKPAATTGSMTAHGGSVVIGATTVLIGTGATAPTAVMPISKIPFSKITTIDKVKAAYIGQGENLRTAAANQAEIRALAAQDEEEEQEEERELPKLEGEIIFVNGFLSDPITNSEAVLHNAISDKYPDSTDDNPLTGENAFEGDRTDQADIYTDDEYNEDIGMDKSKSQLRKEERARRKHRKEPLHADLIINYPKDKYQGYWNSKSNRKEATSQYATYFNAGTRVNYINGSHGLSSSGSHRVDHGIALGYAWAKDNWKIKEKSIIDAEIAEKPQIESYTPQYMPVTIVGHSQGCCMAAGVVLGIIKYAKDLNWDKVAINIVFLGVHQPRGLSGNEYDEFIKLKLEKYMVNQNAFLTGKKEKASNKFLNKISELYSDEHHKLHNVRGLSEHVKNICGDWETYKSRAVQFTFSNDHGDLVSIDGDIPEIKSACRDKVNTSLFSVEYFHLKEEIVNVFDKRVFDLKLHSAGDGFLLIPKYNAEQRFEFKALKKKEHKNTVEENKYGLQWNGYESIAISWGVAMYNFKEAVLNYETNANEKFDPEDIFGLVSGGEGRRRRLKERIIKNQKKIKNLKKENSSKEKRWYHKIAILSYKVMLLNYAAIQQADLYAHFSPVGLINHTKFLKDKNGDFNDQYGNDTILDRIFKAGNDRFYRMEYGKMKLTDEEKREKDKEYVERSKTKIKLIDTSIADTEYINNVVQAYVYKVDGYEEKLHDEREYKPNYKG
ncbi:PAAR domain-containing protein [Olleya sp. HaHaR_3_96]|uniref:PAAR domain-containing protein n=1 Tax=Olleya sp. HaHaR_3_96 TaxID=2745560 RepID=UPI001C4F1473|nr:PAAR domain-containing protein [Olleya sp. HaHaR_3_96]QXP61560.1 PAAR domain-containing protein [Olleya sp. HaHaR_3_96]